MALFLVTVVQQREQEFYVRVRTRDDAQAGAEELVGLLDGAEWVEVDTDVMLTQVNQAPQGEPVWTGGESGDWKIA